MDCTQEFLIHLTIVVRKFRKLSGLSQENMAFECDLSLRGYQKIENNESKNLKIGTIGQIANAFDMDIFEFNEEVQRARDTDNYMSSM